MKAILVYRNEKNAKKLAEDCAVLESETVHLG